ncbi:MAG: hypothetical protein K5886_09485 [Lachnospiraceae bacterium]|nr:hypothetical protein [Lachnospiraceae bacterium]
MASGIVVIIILIAVVLKMYRANPEQFSSRKYTGNQQGSVNARSAVQQPNQAVKAPGSGSDGFATYRRNTASTHNDPGDNKIYRRMEDRKNDWMAKQLRYEKAAYYEVRKMFDFKYDAKSDHEKNCDAGIVRDEHRRNCDAEGIDTGTGR